MYVGSWPKFCGTPWELTKHSWMFVRFLWGYLQIAFCYTTHVFQCFMSYVYISICVNRLTFLSEKQKIVPSIPTISDLSNLPSSHLTNKLYIRVYQKSNDGSFPILNPALPSTTLGIFFAECSGPRSHFLGLAFRTAGRLPHPPRLKK